MDRLLVRLITGTGFASILLNQKVPDVVVAGLRAGFEECQRQFRWDKWNCPKSGFSAVIHTSQSTVTREDAFLHAIASAGVMYMLAKEGCYAGAFPLCGCQYRHYKRIGTKDESWDWGGCIVNVRFAEDVSKQVFAFLENGTGIRSALRKHNHAVGRKIAKHKAVLWCKCHGQTGGCYYKTCWKRLKEFRKTAKSLKRRYKRAKLIDYEAEKQQSPNGIYHSQLLNRSQELVYSDKSPDYCGDVSGLNGASHRECLQATNDTSKHETCNTLCKDCGHQIVEKMENVTVKCGCEFHWCCAIQCKICQKTVKRNYCQ